MARTRIPICVFMKPPRRGEVKTRLLPLVSPETAAELARAFFLDTIHAVSRIPWARTIIASPEVLPPELNPLDLEVWLQGDGDLGARLGRILNRALADAPAAIAIGSDSPGLPGRFLEECRSALTYFDSVFGPCDDGGFYLVGLRRYTEGLFSDVSWSCDDTMDRVLDRFRHFGFSTNLLDEWFDIDRPEDLARMNTAVEQGQIVAPATAKVLERIEVRNEARRRATVS